MLLTTHYMDEAQYLADRRSSGHRWKTYTSRFIAFGNDTPSWILWFARVFPVRHFALGMQAGLLGTAFSWTDVLIVAAWGVGGLLVAVRVFSWEPHRG